jgi:hypothetical protein
MWVQIPTLNGFANVNLEKIHRFQHVHERRNLLIGGGGYGDGHGNESFGECSVLMLMRWIARTRKTLYATEHSNMHVIVATITFLKWDGL